jgi:transcriptional regulator with PAS, ATPase and Fis domain
LESELFGYERGAFTGAQNKRHGIFHYANGGTLFLDEVGEMSLGMQAKLLRVLQDKEFSPVGGDYSKPEKSDFRLICATHKDLQQEMQAEHFRSDLYYRIRVLELKIPSLKDRPEDITFLAKQFSQKFAKEYEKGLILISNDAMDILKQYHWPGNIRELENIIEGAVISVPMNGTVEVTHLPPEFQPDSSKIQVPGTLTPEEQKRWEVLKAHSFNIPKAANALGISRQGFHKYINDHPMLMRIYSREKELMDARIKHPKSSAKVGHTELPPAPSIKIEDKF